LSYVSVGTGCTAVAAYMDHGTLTCTAGHHKYTSRSATACSLQDRVKGSPGAVFQVDRRLWKVRLWNACINGCVYATTAVLCVAVAACPQELRREMEVMDGRGMKQEGPRLVVRCWTDPAFKARLLHVSLRIMLLACVNTDV
jgi:hypothetical protein